jgi:dTDP-glucose 4,6-dehydratase
MKRVLVTGGAGFIGSEFVRQVCADPSVEQVWVLDKLTYAGDLNRIDAELAQNKVKLIHADLLESDKYLDALSLADTLVHFAAESHVDRSIKNGFPFVESNVLGTFTLLEAARSNPTLQIIHASTDEVYGSVNDGESLETDQLRPSSSYSSSKASSDLIALAQRHTFGQKITVTRCCNNYGPWQDKEKVIPTFILKSIQGNPMPIYGNGMNIREWIHVSDHVRAILYLINTRSNDDIVNIGTSERLTNLELAEIIAKELGISDNFLSYVDDRLGHDYRYALNSRKINDLGWNPVKTIKTGLVETVQWYKENANYFLETD